jgi:hypothetical protein
VTRRQAAAPLAVKLAGAPSTILDMARATRSGEVVHHLEWTLRNESTIWRTFRHPVRPNFYRFATELRKWLQKESSILPILLPGNLAFYNPYSRPASILIRAFQRVEWDCGTFARDPSVDLLDFAEAEVRRIRLFSEFVLYATRICEALIKQLLYCTGFEQKLYRRAALGALLAQPCDGCRRERNEKHSYSLLGSLAHRYALCGAYDECLDVDLAKFNTLRNLTAAHASVADIRAASSVEARQISKSEVVEAGSTFLHMLRHISQIELRMWDELVSKIVTYTPPPPEPVPGGYMRTMPGYVSVTRQPSGALGRQRAGCEAFMESVQTRKS